MDAERVGEAVSVRELADALEVGDVDRRDDDLDDPGGARARHDLVAIGIEIGGVEVAMRVDPHGSMMPGAGAVTGHGRRATVLTKACGDTGAQLARHPGAA